MKTWMHNKFKQCGVDYLEEHCAAVYNYYVTDYYSEKTGNV